MDVLGTSDADEDAGAGPVAGTGGGGMLLRPLMNCNEWGDVPVEEVLGSENERSRVIGSGCVGTEDESCGLSCEMGRGGRLAE